jgi:RimJ/RimL family protein N-acetyltransferase
MEPAVNRHLKGKILMQYRKLKECEAVFLTQIFSIPEYDLYFAENDTTEEEWKKRVSIFDAEHSYIISNDNTDIGWIMYTICDNICKLDIVVLLSEERNKGYGKQIMKDLFVLNPQLRKIMLDVQQRNEQAISFYKKIGFQITGEENQLVNGINVPYYNMVLDI